MKWFKNFIYVSFVFIMGFVYLQILPTLISSDDIMMFGIGVSIVVVTIAVLSVAITNIFKSEEK